MPSSLRSTQVVQPDPGITGSQAGLSHANDDGPSSAEMVKFNRLPKSQLWIICFQIWQGW